LADRKFAGVVPVLVKLQRPPPDIRIFLPQRLLFSSTQHAPAAAAGGERAHQPGGAAADDDDVRFHRLDLDELLAEVGAGVDAAQRGREVVQALDDVELALELAAAAHGAIAAIASSARCM
jgi:hypothetical protein